MTQKIDSVRKKGFRHRVTDEQIRFFRSLPIEERLRWLEEAQEFMWKAMPKKNWEIMQKFRRGEL